MINGNLVGNGAVSGFGGWRSELLATYATDKVSQTTGVDAETISNRPFRFVTASVKAPLT